jgi:16S rRNA (cytosine1402-N4)-methyltransferase
MHQPVLLKEILEYLNPKPGQNFIDCTIGLAGHALPIARRILPQGKILGIELDEKVLKELSRIIAGQENIILKQGDFAHLEKIVGQIDFRPVNGILFDLGMSSWQIEESGRGFSFQKDEPLLMSYQAGGLTAEKIVNQWPEEDLVKILREYGQERYARKITQRISQVRQIRPIKTTKQLVEIIERAIPAQYYHQRIHLATRTFQALRIAVNDELNNLEKALPQALEILEREGRLGIISFHSLEDRIVKNFFRQAAQKGNLKILTKKPIRPSQEEVISNPRSRSAKLRVASKQ